MSTGDKSCVAQVCYYDDKTTTRSSDFDHSRLEVDHRLDRRSELVSEVSDNN